MTYYVYILTNYKRTVLYIGFTGNLEERLAQHKSFQIEGFTKKYKANILIYYEAFDEIEEAKHRERCLKRWKRDWKDALISRANPEWEEILVA